MLTYTVVVVLRPRLGCAAVQDSNRGRLCDARAKQKPGACGLGFLFWWAIPISARTQNLTKGDGLGVLFEVEVQHHPVLKDIDRVDEVVDDLPLVSRTVHISLPKLLKPEQDLFPAQSRMLQFFFQDAGLEGVPAGFQLVQALLGGRS